MNPMPGVQWIPQNLPEETNLQQEQPTQDENHEPISPNRIEEEPLISYETQSPNPQSSHIPSSKRANTKSCIPRALKNLEDFNSQGLKE